MKSFLLILSVSFSNSSFFNWIASLFKRSCEQKKNKQKGKMKEFMSFFCSFLFLTKKDFFHQTNRIFVDERSINQPLNQSLNQQQFNAMDSNNATTQSQRISQPENVFDFLIFRIFELLTFELLNFWAFDDF